jgi:hypothetical protein
VHNLHYYKLSPFLAHWGGGTTTTFSGRLIFLQLTWEVGLPPLLWSVPPTAAFTSFPASACWAGAVTPAFSGWLVYLQFHRGLPLPTSLALRAPCPLCYMFFCYCLLFSFSFFPVWGSVYPGAMLIWPRIVCGSNMCCLAHLVVCVFQSSLGAGVWQRGSPPGFSI